MVFFGCKRSRGLTSLGFFGRWVAESFSSSMTSWLLFQASLHFWGRDGKFFGGGRVVYMGVGQNP